MNIYAHQSFYIHNAYGIFENISKKQRINEKTSMMRFHYSANQTAVSIPPEPAPAKPANPRGISQLHSFRNAGVCLSVLPT